MSIQVDPAALRSSASLLRVEAENLEVPSGLQACYMLGGLFAEVAAQRVGPVASGVTARTDGAVNSFASALEATATDFETTDVALSGR